MKKIMSVVLVLLMLAVFAVPCFAAEAANFSVSVVSENDSEVVVAVNYEGGSSFSNFDYELKYKADRLKPTEAIDGDGMFEFVKYAKKNQGLAVSAINPDSNPIKGNYAGTIPFKAVNGKDLFVITFQKLSKDKLSKNDISLSFSNCQLNDSKVPASISTPWSGGSAADNGTVSQAQKPDKTVNTAENPSAVPTDSKAPDASKAENPVGESGTLNDYSAENDGAEEIYAQDNEAESKEIGEAEKKDNGLKKKIWIPAIAICVVFVAAAVVVFIRKKDIREK